MAEIKYDVIKPNLYIHSNCVYFGLEPADFVKASRCIDEVVSRNIGSLKISEVDFLVRLDLGKIKHSEEEMETLRKYTKPLEDYLKTFPDGIIPLERDLEGEISNEYAKLFNVGYLVHAVTLEDPSLVGIWNKLKLSRDEVLKDIEKDESLNKLLGLRIDAERTLAERKRIYDELSSSIPKSCAGLTVVNGEITLNGFGDQKLAGCVAFNQLKDDGQESIENTKSELVERLKSFDGPCLSRDVPQLIDQVLNLTYFAKNIVLSYGDVLTPLWRSKLFRFDP
ncbi:hypothetical protein HYT51_02545 [Candidatus Woesearchaeota archaeon]|nr:hypothetical protein [Candidatus Woesearchaeota archaeon]